MLHLKKYYFSERMLRKGKFEAIGKFFQTYQRTFNYKLFEHSAKNNIFILELVKRRGRKVKKAKY